MVIIRNLMPTLSLVHVDKNMAFSVTAVLYFGS